MVHPTSPSSARELDSSRFDLGALTREQRSITAKIVNKFREAAVAQVLTGPRECGKTTVALAVAQSLEPGALPVFISKSGDLPPAQKRLMQEAYGSYPYLLAAILKQLGFYVRGEEHDLVDQMVEQIRKLRREEKRILLVLDDAEDFQEEVWKRFQAWLDFQDGGIRMFQVLIVGQPEFKSKLAESALRGWRRWTMARHELTLLSWRSVGEETRRILRQVCDAINARSKTDEPVTPPSVSWFAIQRIARESGGRPGRLTELVKRTLSASIREGGRRITSRFLARADALRSPAVQMYRARKAKANQPSVERARSSHAAGRPAGPPLHPLGWFRYALGFLLVAFVLGAGWGITAWLSIPTGDSELADSYGNGSAVETEGAAEDDGPFLAGDFSDAPIDYDLSETLSATTADAGLDALLSPFNNTDSPWEVEEETEAEVAGGWNSISEAEVADATVGAPLPDVEEQVTEASVPTATASLEPDPLDIQMSEVPSTAPEAEPPVAHAAPPKKEERPIGAIRVEGPAPRQETVSSPRSATAPVVTAPPLAEPAPPAQARPSGPKKIPNQEILDRLSRMAKALE